MKLIIDTDVLDKLGVPKRIIFCTMATYFQSPIDEDTIRQAEKRGFTKNDDITAAGIELIENLFLDSEFPKNEAKFYDELASKMRELYPVGRKPGTAYMWRDSNRAIATRLKTFVKKYNVKLKEDEVLKATKAYVDSFNGIYTYMHLLKYFIFKDDDSELLSYLENKSNLEESNNDWQVSVR